ncbi:MAG TPA: translocation/assembly module TamB domain-containing protein [Steroidobacteraceae bacterium]|nr:translocation/assembly module TamB domain-containing protein [Steroidobacteraceae bacterium]
MKRWLIRIAVTLAVLFVVLTGLAWFFGATETGLRWIVAAVNAMPLKKVQLAISDVHGTLIDGFRVGTVRVSAERARVEVDGIDGDADFWRLVGGTVSLDHLDVAKVRVTVISHPSTDNKPARFLPGFLHIRVAKLDARDIDIALANGTHLAYDHVTARASLSSGSIGASSLDAHSEILSGRGSVRLLAAQPLALSGDLDVVFTQPHQPAWRGHVQLKGDLDRLAFGTDIAEPFHATGRGEMANLTKAWQLRGIVAIFDFDVKAWQPGSTLGPVTAGLEIGASHEGYSAKGKVTPRDLGTGTLNVIWHGHYQDRVLHFDELNVRPEGARGDLAAHGTITLTGDRPRLDFTADWRNLQWPVRGPATVLSERGHGAIAGQWPLEFKTDVRILVPDLPAAQLTARGEIASGHIAVRSANGSWLDGSVTAQGDVRYGENAGWQVTASGAKLNPALWQKSWPGQLDFALKAQADGLKSTSTWQVTVDRLRGRVRGQALSANGTLRRHGTGFDFERVALDLGSTHLRVDGSVADEIALTWTLSSPDLAKTLAGASGRVQSAGSFAGTAGAFAVKGHIDADDLGYTGFAVKKINGDVDIDLRDRGASRAQIIASGISWSGYDVDAFELQLSGKTAQHDWTISGRVADTQMALGGQGHYAAPLWNASLDRWTLDEPDGPHLKLAAPAAISIGVDQLSLTSACLAAEEERFCAAGTLTPLGAWKLTASAVRMPLKALGRGLPGRPEFDGYLAMLLDASAQPGLPWTGSARADLSNAQFQYRLRRGQREQLTLGEAHAEVVAKPDQFAGSISVHATATTFIEANATLTRLAGRDFGEQTLAGALRAEIRELGLIPQFVTDVDHVDGVLRTNFTLGGTPHAPDLNGDLRIDAKEIDLYQLNLQLRNTVLAAQLRGNALTLDASTHAGDGDATVAGHLAWSDGQPKGDMTLKGNHLRLVNVPEIRIIASPDLSLHVDGRRIDVDGEVKVPYARIAPLELTDAVLASSDEVIVGAPVIPPEKRFQVRSRLALTLGNDVRIDTHGLVGKLSGSVTSTSGPDDPGTGVGELKVDEGKYTVLARRLDIERGRLIFNGGPLGNPGVDIRATRKLPDIVVGANVRGTLREPTLSFFSDPPVTQSQIVSLLVGGGTLESLQSNQAQQVGAARNALLAQGGAILASELGAKIGIADVTVESNEQNDTSLVLGRFLSPRFYISYGVSLTESINTLKLQYTLGDRWTIRTESGEAMSADIVYTIEH